MATQAQKDRKLKAAEARVIAADNKLGKLREKLNALEVSYRVEKEKLEVALKQVITDLETAEAAAEWVRQMPVTDLAPEIVDGDPADDGDPDDVTD
jgi:hypothetical protein